MRSFYDYWQFVNAFESINAIHRTTFFSLSFSTYFFIFFLSFLFYFVLQLLAAVLPYPSFSTCFPSAAPLSHIFFSHLAFFSFSSSLSSSCFALAFFVTSNISPFYYIHPPPFLFLKFASSLDFIWFAGDSPFAIHQMFRCVMQTY